MKTDYSRLKKVVEEELSCSAHNIAHVMRVYELCMSLAKGVDNINIDVLAKASLLHDIAKVKEDADNTGKIDHAKLGAQMSEEILKSLGDIENIDHVKDCIRTHRFRSDDAPQTVEAKILFDADKLDIIGAIGIARGYMIAGQYNQSVYFDGLVKDYVSQNLVGGKCNGRIKDISKHTVNLEFETKLKLIPEKLYTQRARKIGLKRINFMKNFFAELERDMNGQL